MNCLHQGSVQRIEEYWQISAIDGSCDSMQVNLQIPLEIESDSRWSEILDQVYKEYPTHCLIVDAIGKFENGSQDGYGHLGTKNSQLNVQRIIIMQSSINRHLRRCSNYSFLKYLKSVHS
jgi:hypothetical protein